jgi:hypothetical protein
LPVETNLSNIKLAIKIYQRKRSKRSFFALQMGQTSGGFSRAQRYPQTLHRHTGKGKLDKLAFSAFTFFLFSGGGRRSWIDDISCFPLATASAT